MKFRFALSCLFLFACATLATAQDQDAELAVGDAAPDFELATFDDATVTLSERFGEEGKPVVLLFSRASW